MLGPKLEVIREEEHAPQPKQEPSQRVLWLISGFLIIAAAIACALWTQRAFQTSLRVLDDRALDQASTTLRVLVAREGRLLEAEARVLADDARVRTTLATPGIDAATIEDVLNDLLQAGQVALVGIVDGDGKISAISGANELRGIDFSSAQLIKDALARGSGYDLWTLKDRAVTVAMAKVSLGESTRFLLLGTDLDLQSLERLQEALNVSSALVVHDRIAGTQAFSPEKKAAFEGALKLQADVPHLLAEQQLILQPMQLDDGPGGSRVIWAVSERHAERIFSSLRLWMLVPAAGMATAGLALLVIGFKK